MSISLNNHESRIKALENGGAGSWSNGSGNGSYWLKENKTGIIIQFGRYGSDGAASGTTKFLKPFSSATSYTVVVTQTAPGTGINWSYASRVRDLTAEQFSWWVNNLPLQWIAIGYLISYRILNYAYACKSLLFTPLMKWRCE